MLLDTCAIIRWLREDRFPPELRERLIESGREGGVLVSPVSAWEIGLLARKPGYSFPPDARAWCEAVMALPIITEAALTAGRAVDASRLPGELHRDPVDRLLVATARDLGAALVTCDRKLLDYAASGHLHVLPF